MEGIHGPLNRALKAYEDLIFLRCLPSINNRRRSPSGLRSPAWSQITSRNYFMKSILFLPKMKWGIRVYGKSPSLKKGDFKGFVQ